MSVPPIRNVIPYPVHADSPSKLENSLLERALTKRDKPKVIELLSKTTELTSTTFLLLSETYPDLACTAATLPLIEELDKADINTLCLSQKNSELLCRFIDLGFVFEEFPRLVLLNNKLYQVLEKCVEQTPSLAQEPIGRKLFKASAIEGRIDAVKRLLELGADPLHKNVIGEAVSKNQLDCAELILTSLTPCELEKRGLKKDFRDHEWQNVLLKLVSKNQVVYSDEAFEYFCTKYPLFMTRLIESYPGLAKQASYKLISTLIQTYEVDNPSSCLLSTLLKHKCPIFSYYLVKALSLKLVEVANQLLDANVATDGIGQDEMTTLHYAAEIGDIALVNRLLSHPTNVFALNSAGKKASDLASSSPAVQKRLLEAEFAVVACGGDENLICHYMDLGVRVTSTEMYEIIHRGLSKASLKCLDLRIDPAFRSATGDTYLHAAMMLKDDTITSKLFELGVDPLHPNDFGQTIFMNEYAAKWLQKDCEDLEIELCLNHKENACSQFALIPENEKLEKVRMLSERYPHSIPTIMNFFFEVDDYHLFEGTLSLITTTPPKAKKCDLTMLIERFKKVAKASEEEKTIAGLELFISRVQKKERFTGTPEGPAFIEQYKDIKNLLRHLIHHLETEENDPRYPQKVCDIAKEVALASSECFIQYRHTALTLYNKYLGRVEQTPENALKVELQQLRDTIASGMTSEPYVNSRQGVHAIQYIKHRFGASWQLSDRAQYRTALPYDGAGFVNYEIPQDSAIERSFRRHYTPGALYDAIRSSTKDERFRNHYIDLAKKALKPYLPGQKTFKENKARLKKLRTKILDAKALERMPHIQKLQDVVRELDLFVPRGYTPLAALKDARQGEIMHFIYNEATFTPNPYPIILLLLSQKAIRFRV